jgi:cytochrome d ubiquinol oxidase subunit II
VTGALFVATCAYTAAVFLARDAGSAGDEELARYFANRALTMAVIAGVAALLGIFALHDDARYVYNRLTSEGLPLVILSGVCGIGALALLVRRVSRGIRPLAVGAVVAMIWGFFVAQFPYMLPTSLRIGDAAGASATLTGVIVVFLVAGVTCVPALALLYVLAQRRALE